MRRVEGGGEKVRKVFIVFFLRFLVDMTEKIDFLHKLDIESESFLVSEESEGRRKKLENNRKK